MGSSVSGITQFRDAEETTIGSGFYLTSQKDAAIGYVYVRANDRKLQTPVVYESEIVDANVLTLTTKTAIMDFMKFFRQKLIYWGRDQLPKLEISEMQRMMGQETRNKLTDYWSEHGVKKGEDFFGFSGTFNEKNC